MGLDRDMFSEAPEQLLELGELSMRCSSIKDMGQVVVMVTEGDACSLMSSGWDRLCEGQRVGVRCSDERHGELTDEIARPGLSGLLAHTLTHTGYLTSSRSLLSLSSLTWDGRVELGLAPGSKLDVCPPLTFQTKAWNVTLGSQVHAREGI